MITQSYTCMSREEAKKAIKRTRRLLMSADDDAVSQRLDLDVALDLLTSGKIAYGKHHFPSWCIPRRWKARLLIRMKSVTR
nr:type IV secretion system ATPase VirB4 [Klebsiella pneumoniae]